MSAASVDRCLVAQVDARVLPRHDGRRRAARQRRQHEQDGAKDGGGAEDGACRTVFAAGAGGGSPCRPSCSPPGRIPIDRIRPPPTRAGPQDVAVQRKQPVELPVDPQQNVHVLRGRCRDRRRHDTALPEADHPDHRAPDVKLAAFPPAFRQPRNAGDEQVRPKPPPVRSRATRPRRRSRRAEATTSNRSRPSSRSSRRAGPGGLLHVPARHRGRARGGRPPGARRLRPASRGESKSCGRDRDVTTRPR